MPAVSAGWQELVWLCPPTELGDSPILPEDSFQRNGVQVLEKDTPQLQKIQIHFKGTEEGLTIISLFW